MTKPKLRKFDPANYLKSEKDLALYLEAWLKEGGDELAEKTGMTRAGLYKALGSNPSFGAVPKVIRAMGGIHIAPQR